MAANAELGLQLDLSGFRRGVQDASQQIKTGFDSKNLRGFDAGLDNLTSKTRSLFSELDAGASAAQLALSSAAINGVGAIGASLRSAGGAAAGVMATLGSMGGVAISAGTAIGVGLVAGFAAAYPAIYRGTNSLLKRVEAILGDTEAWDKIETNIKKLFRSIATIAGNYLQNITDQIEDIGLNVADMYKMLGRQVLPSGAYSELVDEVETGNQMIAESMAKRLGSTRRASKDAASAVDEIAQALRSAGKEASIAAKQVESLAPPPETVKEYTRLTEAIRGETSRLMMWMKSTSKSIASSILSVFATVGKGIIKVLNPRSWAGALTSGIKSALSGLGSVFKSTFGKLDELALGAVRGVGKAFKALPGLVMSAIKSIPSMLSAGVSAVAGAATAMAAVVAAAFAAAVAAGYVFWRVATRAVEAVRELNDASARLRGSLEFSARAFGNAFSEQTIGNVQRLSSSLAAIYGMRTPEILTAAQEFAAQGFDESRIKGLTTLAANVAKSTGRSLEEVTKKIVEAANGQTDGLKELGVYVQRSGDSLTDANTGLALLADRYGEMGEVIVNPSEQLSTTIQELWTSLGERILPSFDSLVTYVNEFIRGLMESPEIMESIGSWMSWILDSVQLIPKYIEGVFNMVRGGGNATYAWMQQLFNTAMSWISEQIAKLIEGIPGLSKIIDPQSIRDMGAAFGQMAGEGNRQIADGMQQWQKGLDQIAQASIGDKSGSWFDSVAAKGRESIEKMKGEAKSAIAELDGKDNTAPEFRRAQQEEKRKKAREEMDKRVSAYADARSGQNVNVRIVSTRPDRFRKARSR